MRRSWQRRLRAGGVVLLLTLTAGAGASTFIVGPGAHPGASPVSSTAAARAPSLTCHGECVQRLLPALGMR